MLYELLGGLLIGAAASLLWLGVGRISGMTGVLSSLFMLTRNEQWRRRGWALAFFMGLVVAYPIYMLSGGEAPIEMSDNALLWASAGLIVGFGTYLGNGCTSGHGVCGMGRMSLRSVVATVTFIATGVLTVAIMNMLEVGA
ncbi:MAG: hypothetical protein CMI09_15025 [Oceanospirillaceae bacterium]|nr:hypothetical protein [Oceanospirillaceae bacterium]